MEFEQTFRFVITQIPRICTGYRISKDLLNEDVYDFTSYWATISAAKTFTQSPVFLMMLGAFNTLGKLYENISGEMIMTPNIPNPSSEFFNLPLKSEDN